MNGYWILGLESQRLWVNQSVSIRLLQEKEMPGSLMKALMRPGGGDSRPSDGDQVIYHCTIQTLDGVVVESTRSENGGRGAPIRHVFGKSKMIVGLLEGISTMLKGEVAT